MRNLFHIGIVLGLAWLCTLPLSAQAQFPLHDIKIDHQKPIHVQSMTLNLKPNEQKAIFAGDTKITQDSLTIEAATLTAWYHNKESKQRVNEAINNSNLSRLKADGYITLKLPGRKAEADQGIYDIDAGYIELIGNVVLTQQQNVLKGEYFTYNVVTGISRLRNAKTPTNAANDTAKDASTDAASTSDPTEATPSTNTRVRGLLIPTKRPENPVENLPKTTEPSLDKPATTTAPATPKKKPAAPIVPETPTP